MHSAQLLAFFAIRQTGFVARTTYDNSTHCLSFKAPPYATFQDGKWYVLRTPKQCPVFARAMICQETQYELIQFDDCLNSRRTKTSTCPLVSCNTDAYISTPAGLLLRTNSTAIKIVSHKSSEQGTSHPHMQTISSVAERRMPDHQVTFVKWDQNTTSVSFGDIVIHSPENAAPNSIMYRKPPLLVPRIDREGMIKIPGLGAESLAKDVINFQADLKELREEQKVIAALPGAQPLIGETIKTIEMIPKYFEIAFIVAAILLAFFVLKTIKDCVAPNTNLCPPPCCKNRRNSARVHFNTDADRYGEARSSTLPRSESHISLVVNAGESTKPTAPMVQPEPEQPGGTLPRSYASHYMYPAGYHPVYPGVQDGDHTL